jgi:hypothetical protein
VERHSIAGGSGKTNMKIGLDIHGVIDAHRKFFSDLTMMIQRDNFMLDTLKSEIPRHEVHILTGPSLKKLKPGELLGIYYTHFFSIIDYCVEHGAGVRYENGDLSNPWVDDVEMWNRAKSEYAEKHNLDFTLDDTAAYAPHFKTPIAIVKRERKNDTITSTPVG